MRGTIRRHGRRFEVRIYLGRDALTGRKRYSYHSFATYQQAQAALPDLLAQAQASRTAFGTAPPARMTVREYLLQWLASVTAPSPKTLETYAYHVNQRLLPGLGSVPLARLSAMQIQRFFKGLMEGGLSPDTVDGARRVLHTALAHAVSHGILPRNPMDAVRLPRPPRRPRTLWDEEQMRMFMAEAKRSSRYYGLYLCIVCTGLRPSEALALRWEDVDLHSGHLRVSRQYYRIGRRQVWKEPKTAAGRRTVAVPRVVVEELVEIRRGQDALRLEVGRCPRGEACRDGRCPLWHEHGLVFCQPNGRPLDWHNITQRDFRRMSRQLGLPAIRAYDLRHAHATFLLALGVHPKVVQERLGHSRIQVTMDTYSHVLPGLQEEATRRLEERLFGRGEGA